MERACFIFSMLILLLKISTFSSSSAVTSNNTTDQSALFTLKSRIIVDPNNLLMNNWSISTSACNWIGVTCSSLHHERIIALNLSDMSLIGTIPPQMGNLSFLVSLDLKNNSFNGTLPKELAHLRRLKQVDLRDNKFGGEIPSWFSLLPNLKGLFLSYNGFTGTIPPSFSNISKLEQLKLGGNSLQGNIPMEFGSLVNLKLLSLTDNKLTGSIPLTIFNISTLRIIILSNNNLSGNLPTDICRGFPNIEEIHLPANNFSGPIPSGLHECSRLRVLSMSSNKFSGIIPRNVGNLTMLKELDIGNNNLKGEVPQEIGSLGNLELLLIEYNSLGGAIPATIFNISTLQVISIMFNNLSGEFPSNIGYNLPNLRSMYLSNNFLSGILPNSLSNASQLSVLDLCNNSFTGTIPTSLGKLGLLQRLKLEINSFISESSSQEFSFLTALTNCRNLHELSIYSNPLSGFLPTSIGNFSDKLTKIIATQCGIMGKIPSEIGNLSGLIELQLGGNELLTGNIPSTIKGLSKLQMLDITNSNITGSIPDDLCHLQYLYDLSIGGNQILGSIPSCFGSFTFLKFLHLDSNWLTSSLPVSLGNLKDLLVLDVSSNSLSSHIPQEIGNLKVAVIMNLSYNHFSGYIPSVLGGLQSVTKLSLENNRLQGPIPITFKNLVSLEYLDLSNNNLSGVIPKSLEGILSLTYFNASFNRFRGEIPSGGNFKNFTSQFFLGNEALCGDPQFQVPKCPTSSGHGSRKKRVLLVVCISLAVALIMFTLIFAFVLIRRGKGSKVPSQPNLPHIPTCERISYRELQQATDDFNETNLLGMGSFGSVFKGVLENGTTVAVKVFNLQQEGGFKSFGVECEVLCNLRHRNLGKIISFCSNLNFKALVLEYMPNGSLEKWLYSHNQFLNIVQRIDIMIDVGCALDYLHKGYSTPVVHCDLKPSNVLLDKDMVAHLFDFGIAKLLEEDDSIAQTMTLATIGYIAPEYGSEGLVSTKCDVYSYGIMLMEMFTRTKPTDEKFVGDHMSLKRWVNDSLPNSVAQVMDANLPRQEDDHIVQWVSSLMELALKCCAESPEERINLNDVLSALRKIRLQLLPNH